MSLLQHIAGLAGWDEIRVNSFDESSFGKTSLSMFSHYGALMEVLVYKYVTIADVTDVDTFASFNLE